MPSRIVDFYTGASPDHRGRFLREIQQWPDERIEAVHDFIQWLFPLREPSPVNPDAPTIDAETVAAFAEQPELRAALRVSFDRMLRFYGFERGQDVKRSADFARQAENWLTPGNHNHLRITRILKCLSALGLGEEARAFFAALAELYQEEAVKPRPRITSATFNFWQSAQ